MNLREWVRRGRGGIFAVLAAVLIAAPTAAGGVISAATPAAAATTPAFVQQASAHGSGTTLSAATGASVASGDRLVVEVAVWSGGKATASSVTDSLGDSFVEVTHFTATDNTEMSVWTAPVPTGGSRDTVTAKPSGSADLGIVALDYSGLSPVADITAVDQLSHSAGATSGAGSVQAPATPATTAAGELAVGFYADSGFGDTLAGGSGYTVRANVSPASDMEMLAEDQSLPQAGAKPAASAATGASTVWLMATVVFASAVPSAPGTPSGVGGTPGNGSATVNWTAPSSGGSPITSYTVTPYIGSSAQTPTVITGSPPATTATVTGLTNGTAYTFTVTATNAAGTSPESAATGLVVPSSQPQGQWSTVQSMPFEAISSILMDNGKFVFWDGWQQPQPSIVWDPASPAAFTTVNAPDSVFCDGAAQLPDGRIIVAGGYGGLSTGQIGINDTNIFDPSTSTWSRVANMRFPRWYPTLTEMADGRYLAISGNSTNASTWADTPEIYDPSANTWTALTGISTSQVHEEEYPFSYLIPNGNDLTIGPSEDVTYELNVGSQTWKPAGGQSGILNGSSDQYLPGKILYSGGAAGITGQAAQATTAVLDTNAANPSWQQTQPMLHPRVYHTLVTLANGQVLAVGGEGTSDQSVVTTGVMPTEIWDPVSQTWSAAAPVSAARNYHSTAVLMPDGTVLSAGGGHYNGLNDQAQDNYQIYSPSYLFNGARPTITSAPSSSAYGSTISVTTPDASSISAVNLVSLGADTHQIDMNQHFVPLHFTAGNGSLSVTMPSSAADAPPGHYMLFILNKSGTPSVASMIGLTPSTTPVAPAAPTGVTATAGDGTASVSWTAPNDGNSPITSYTITPHAGSASLPPTVVSGNPPATKATVSGLTDGTAYTFTVTATNSVGTSPASAGSNQVTPTAPTPPTGTPAPAFVQQASAHSGGQTSLSVTMPSAVTTGDRLVVEAADWSSGHATIGSVTDSAGDTFTEVTTATGPDGTQLSVWTAPVTASGGTSPTIMVKPTAKADIGLTALEYSGLSAASGTGAVDQTATATGTTTTARAISSGSTAATTAPGELAVGFYSDSGFGDTLTADPGYTSRANVAPDGDMEMLVEDRSVGQGATPAPSVTTGASTIWEMATVVFKS